MNGKLWSKVVFTKSDTCLIHERRCQHRPAMHHVSAAPYRVRCRGPGLNRLSSTLVQLNQNKFFICSAAGNTTANGSAKQARAPCRQLSARGGNALVCNIMGTQSWLEV